MGSAAAVFVLLPYAVRCIRCDMYARSARRRHMLVLEAVSFGKMSRELTVTKPFFSFSGVHEFVAESADPGVCCRYIDNLKRPRDVFN
jgi:hypothetical protein